jgi:hypothetical protein
MSSDMKDARWGLAMCMADQNDFDWYDLGYEDTEFFLNRAQAELDDYPEEIEYWAKEFRGE